MKLSIIVYSNDPETVWNAFRCANTAATHDEEVAVFLLGKGVEAASAGTLQFDVQEQMDVFRERGGKVIGCGLCCEIRRDTMPHLKEQLQCAMGSMQELHTLVAQADRVLTF